MIDFFCSFFSFVLLAILFAAIAAQISVVIGGAIEYFNRPKK